MRRLYTSLATFVAIVGLTMGAILAQETQRQDRTNIQQRQSDIQPGQEGSRRAGKLDEKTQSANVRVSQLIGKNIENSQGENVGGIRDIVLDAKTSNVRYVAVTYGGFLGLGTKLFAVPFKAFKLQPDPDATDRRNRTAGDFVLVLNVTQEQIEGQEGFDENSWPDAADSKWMVDLNRRYGIESEHAEERISVGDRERDDR